jgi:hypothetical protein
MTLVISLNPNEWTLYVDFDAGRRMAHVLSGIHDLIVMRDGDPVLADTVDKARSEIDLTLMEAETSPVAVRFHDPATWTIVSDVAKVILSRAYVGEDGAA